ncbi:MULTISPECIES: hypothetical protein [unclassified Nonomuraea]|uniref:hypothetical protein n=1 Tax=unclassified Nonomuraea TaxID=2593643 RepID=UPI0033DEE11E
MTQADLDRLGRFQTLTPKDLLDGLTHLANAVTAAQRARWDGQGDLDLPFMRGSLADAVQVSEAIHAFAAAGVDRNTGRPTFTSIQDLFAALGKARGLPGGAIINVADAGYDDAAKKIAFTLVVDRTVNPAPEPLNPAGQTVSGTGAGVTYAARTLRHAGQKWTPGQFAGRTVTAGPSSGIVADNTADTVTLVEEGWRGGVPAAGAPYRISANDPMIGQIAFGDTFKAAAGLDRANATAAVAGVMRGYHASATVVLDLSDPVTGQGCAQRTDGQQKACPYKHVNADGSATVVNELPRAADRIMLRTGRDLFGDASDAQRLGFTVSLNAPPKETYKGFQPGTYDRRTDLLHDTDGDTWTAAALPHDGFAKGGADRMRGGPGRDSMHGGAGDDLVNGDSGGDEVFGGDGDDLLWGGKGCDPALDAATADCLSGGTFDPAARGTGDRFVDHVFGGAGADLLDYNPRGSYPGSCAPGKMPEGELTTVVDPCAWFRMTDKDNAATADDQHHQGVDWQYGGADRDVLQGDRTANGPNAGDKMIDWNGNFNLYTHCGPANGGHNIVRQHSPAMLDFLAKVAWGAGAGRGAGDPSGSREVAVPVSGDSGSPYPTSPGHFDSPVACAG